VGETDVQGLMNGEIIEGMREGEVRDCVLQRSPARKLEGLIGIPVLVVTAEASYHAV